MIETILIGNIGQDAIIRNTNGNEFVSFSVAHTERFKTRDGQEKEETMWVSIALDGNGGNLTKYLTKGKIVCVRGKIKAKPDGKGGVLYYTNNPRVDLIGGGNKQEQPAQTAPISNDPFV